MIDSGVGQYREDSINMNEIHEGGCLCGRVRFEVSDAPYHTTYCHCRRCQRTSGSVVATWADFKAKHFSLLRGNISYYKSSSELERGFCGHCGSTLIQRPLAGDWVAVPTGTFDRPEGFPMREHCGIESHIPWLTIDDSNPRKTTKEAMGYEIEGESR